MNVTNGLDGVLNVGTSSGPVYIGGQYMTVQPDWLGPVDLVERIARSIPGGPMLPVEGYFVQAGYEVPYYVAKTASDLGWVRQWALSAPMLAVDTETSDKRGIYEPNFKLRTVQLATPSAVVYIPYNELSHKWLVDIFERGQAFLMHNASFDLAVLDRFGVASLDMMWPKTVCSMLLAQLVQHPRTRNGDGSWPAKLKELTRKLVDPEYGDDRVLKQRMAQGNRVWVPQKKDPSKGRWKRGPEPWTWATVPTDLPDYILYAVKDPWITIKVFQELYKEFRPWCRTVYGYEARNAWLMNRLSRRGQKVDKDKANELISSFQERLTEIDAIFEMYDLDAENPDTYENKENFVNAMALRGIKLLARNANGTPKLDHDTLVAACEAAGKPDDMLYLAWTDLHQVDKYTTAYVEPFINAYEGDGRVHANIRILGARTGRMSISDPPLQQLPRIGDVRACLRADDGHLLVGADYSAIEMAVAAGLANDKHMQDLINNGTDIHGVVAARVFGPNYTKEQRNVAKRAGFGRLYGAGAAAVAKQCGVSLGVAQDALRMFDREFPAVKRYAKWVAEDSDLVTFTGRHIKADPTRPYASINYIIQSSARDVFMLGGLRAANAGLEEQLWLPIHDEWIVQAPEGDTTAVGVVLESALQSELRGVPLRAEAQLIGRNWVKT